MPTVTSEGIILKHKNFGEADRIVTAFTDRFGKISIVARGVRKITSRRAGNIEVLNRSKLHLFKGKNYTLTEAESLETFSKLKSNLTLTSYAFHILELIDRLLPEEQKNLAVYNLTVQALEVLTKVPRQIVIRAFEVKLLSSLGFWSREILKDVDSPTKKLLKTLEDGEWQEIASLEIREENALALERILRYYIENTLEAELKSLKVIKKLGNE